VSTRQAAVVATAEPSSASACHGEAVAQPGASAKNSRTGKKTSVE
jgi:hypothetical protein